MSEKQKIAKELVILAKNLTAEYGVDEEAAGSGLDYETAYNQTQGAIQALHYAEKYFQKYIDANKDVQDKDVQRYVANAVLERKLIIEAITKLSNSLVS